MRESAACRRSAARWISESHLAAEQVGLALVAEHGQRRAVDEGAAALGVDAVEAFGGRVEQALQRLAAAPHLVLGRGLDPGAVAHEGEAGQAERGRRARGSGRAAGAGSGGRRRPAGSRTGSQRRQQVVEACASALQRSHFGALPGRRPGLRACALSASTRICSIRRRPAVQVAIASAISGVLWNQQEQPDHARDVVVVAAALEQAAPRLGAGRAAAAAWPRARSGRRSARPASLEEAFVVLFAVAARRSRSGGAARPSAPSSRGSRPVT